MSLLRCAKLDPLDTIDVLSEIAEVNRLLERQFPDCTMQSLDIREDAEGTRWVMLELEATPQSSACEEWYCKELARRRIQVLDGVRRNVFD